MTRFGRGVLLVGTPLVMLAVIGAVYFQIYTSSHTTRQAWMVTRSVVAGTQLTASNVQRVTVGSTGTSFALSSENPISEQRRAGHAMQPSHLLASHTPLQGGDHRLELLCPPAAWLNCAGSSRRAATKVRVPASALPQRRA